MMSLAHCHYTAFLPPPPPAAALTLPVHPPLSEQWILVHEETIGTIEGE